MSVQYLDKPFTVSINPVKRTGILQLAPGQSPTGYGKKISTDRMIQLPDHPRKYRVYAIQFSNNASHYIIKNGQPLYLRSCDMD